VLASPSAFGDHKGKLIWSQVLLFISAIAQLGLAVLTDG
jgi:hypothetical protein